jgi:ABC-type lipoprotein export system ATPase subunit
MSDPQALLELEAIVKSYDGPDPLRVAGLRVESGARLAIGGLDAGAAETLIHLITGAALPESGDVTVAGVNTRAIATDTAWLASLDRFGIVTDRAVMIDKLPVAANLALPLTLSIDPMTDAVAAQIRTIAADAGLPPERLEVLVSALTPAERVRLHLARAIAPSPQLILLEHPTATLRDAGASAALGRTLDRVAQRRGLAFLALTNDDAFARASGATRYRLDRRTGEIAKRRLWQAL